MAKRQPPSTTAPTGEPLAEAPDNPVEELEKASEAGDINDDNYEEKLLEMLPESERHLDGAVLFAEACVVYGVNPTIGIRPIEILNDPNRPRFVFYRGDALATPAIPDRVKFVTAGGRKITHPIDYDFERDLRQVFHAFHVDPKSQELVEDPLPADLTLPREAVTGIPVKTEHVYPQGYLRRRAIEAARGRAR